MVVWLEVEDDRQERARASRLIGHLDLDLPPKAEEWARECDEIVPIGVGRARYVGDLFEAGWKPIVLRPGKSVWKAADTLQALSDYWLLIETKEKS